MKAWPLFAASLLLAGAAPPPDARTREDIRCLLATAMLADSKDPQVKQAGAAGALYYLGRLDGRSPGLDIEAAVEAEADSLTEATQGSLLKKCGATLEQRGAYLVQAGKALEKRGK